MKIFEVNIHELFNLRIIDPTVLTLDGKPQERMDIVVDQKKIRMTLTRGAKHPDINFKAQFKTK